MTEPAFIPLPNYRSYPVEEMQQRAAQFASDLQRRRSVRQFSDRAAPRAVIENCLQAAASAPSGRQYAALAFCSCLQRRR
jgi:iodotyrosine deiodinase